jgi:pantoate--beta-alanine ligase
VELIRDVAGLRETTEAWRVAGASVGLVPTMGALHDGHRSLMRAARAASDRVVVSIFVNPLQFGDGEDLERYPRDEEADLAICETERTNVVWAPPVEEVYPLGESLPHPDPGDVGDLYEGAARPGHFGGVLQVVHRLFDVVGSCDAFFGDKDAQQLFLVRRMVEDEPALGVRVVACPTVREPDGLAVSSRNAYLSPEEREQAGCLFLALTEAVERARGGERDANLLVAVMAREIGATPLARLDYAAVVDEATFEPIGVVDRSARAIVAARFPSARLIDNLPLPEPRNPRDGDASRLSGPGAVEDDGPSFRPELEG